MSFRAIASLVTGTSLVFAPMAIAPASATGEVEMAWVATWQDSYGPHNSLQLMNLLDGTVSQRVDLSGSFQPSEIAYSASTDTIWFLSQPWDYSDSSVGYVDASTGASTYELNSTNEQTFHGDDYVIVNDWIGDIAASPDGTKVYVSATNLDSGNGALLVFDAGDGSLLTAVDLAGSDPEGMTVNDATNELYVLTYDEGAENIEIVDTVTDIRTDGSPNLSWGDATCESQTSIDYNEVRDTVYAVCWASNFVATWNVGTDAVSALATDLSDVESSSIGIDTSEDGNSIIVGTCYFGTLLLHLGENGAVTSNIWSEPEGTIKNVRFLPDGTHIAGGNFHGSLFISNAATNAVDNVLFPSNPDGVQVQTNNVYVSDIAPIGYTRNDSELASTGFDSTGLLGLGVLIVGTGVVAVRRRRA